MLKNLCSQRPLNAAFIFGSVASAFTKAIGYGYDVDGNRNTITYPDGKTQTYTYEHGRLKTVQLPNGQNMTWDGYQWQRPEKITMPGGVQTLSYDALQRSKSIEVKASQGAMSGTTLLNRGYTYDAAGNITERQTEEGSYNYEYDQLNRVTQATPPQSVQDKLPVEGFAYDAVHNRIGSIQQPGDWQYNANNQLMQFGVGENQTTYTYTANGHVATKTQNGKTFVYGYDAAGRLASIADKTAGGTEVARYAYDPMGRRISKTVDDVTTYYLYADEGLIVELDGTGNMQVAYGWQADAMYGTAPLWQAQVSDGDLQTAEYHYLITDHLGTPQLAVNSNGQTTWKAYAEAFGKTIPDATNQITMNLRFPGQYFDQETNTHYNYFRDYEPAIGRYIQKDPIGLKGGINVYAYALNNPMIYLDSLGLTAECPPAPPAKNNPAWRPYVGQAWAFHCDYDGYLEAGRDPTPDDPIAECFYDECGRLVDDNHKYPRCKGTPDQYLAEDWVNHTINDTGGVAYEGWGAFKESRRKSADDMFNSYEEIVKERYEQGGRMDF